MTGSFAQGNHARQAQSPNRPRAFVARPTADTGICTGTDAAAGRLPPSWHYPNRRYPLFPPQSAAAVGRPRYPCSRNTTVTAACTWILPEATVSLTWAAVSFDTM